MEVAAAPARTRHDTRSTVRPDCHKHAWITTAEAAHIGGWSVDHVRYLCHLGRIICRPHGAYRIDQTSLQKYLAG